jgi:hypothetical protein
MICTVRFYGVLAMVLSISSGDPVPLELPEDSRYGEVLDAIFEKFGGRFPPSMWNAEKRLFHSSVLAFGDEGRFLPQSRSTPIPDCREIRFHLPLSGG